MWKWGGEDQNQRQLLKARISNTPNHRTFALQRKNIAVQCSFLKRANAIDFLHRYIALKWVDTNERKDDFNTPQQDDLTSLPFHRLPIQTITRQSLHEHYHHKRRPTSCCTLSQLSMSIMSDRKLLGVSLCRLPICASKSPLHILPPIYYLSEGDFLT